MGEIRVRACSSEDLDATVELSLRAWEPVFAAFARLLYVTRAALDWNQDRTDRRLAMLTQAIGELLPAAVAVALSPIPIIGVVLILGTPTARTNGPAFAAGWLAGLILVSVIVLLVAGDTSDPDSATSTGINWLQVALGFLFLSLAAKQWRSRPRDGAQPEMPKWMASIDAITPVRSLGLGVVLSAVNPKNLVLTLSAATSIAQAGLSAGDNAIAVAVFVAIASVTVVGAVVFHFVATDRATAPLASMKEFMSAHNTVIMMVLFVVLGAKLLGDGFGGVTN